MKDAVAILGCGPAGLLAAHAAVQMEHPIKIISVKKPSIMFGAMYLHKPIPEVTSPDPGFMVKILKTGSSWQYAEKVYGDRHAMVSWDKFDEGEVPAWDLKLAYRVLWDLYEGAIHDLKLTPDAVWSLTTNYRHVVSTVPLRSICYEPDKHQFRSQRIWVHHGEQPQDALWDENLMHYNSTPEVEWYRHSIIRGYMSWEYAHEPIHAEEHGFELSSGFKPVYSTCPCHPAVLKVGRYGAWDKHQLSHHAYFKTLEALEPSRVVQ